MADKSISQLYTDNLITWIGTEKVPGVSGSTSGAGLASGIALSVVDTDGTLTANSDIKYASQKAVRTFVLANATGTNQKTEVRVATTAAGTLASSFEDGDTIDGVVLATNDRILIKDQASAPENGIYTVNVSGAPTRATDADAGAELVNAAVLVLLGTANTHRTYKQITPATITLGSSDLVWVLSSDGSADVISNETVSVVDQLMVFADTTGKRIKKWTTTGYALLTAGVLSVRTLAQLVGDLQGTGLTSTEAGFRTIPQNSQSTAYTCVATDSGKHIFHPSADTTARTWTIPANASVAFPIGTVITFVNQNGAGAITIAITTDIMRLAITGAVGNRVLAANGIATALKVTATEWLISGAGVS